MNTSLQSVLHSFYSRFIFNVCAVEITNPVTVVLTISDHLIFIYWFWCVLLLQFTVKEGPRWLFPRLLISKSVVSFSPLPHVFIRLLKGCWITKCQNPKDSAKFLLYRPLLLGWFTEWAPWWYPSPPETRPTFIPQAWISCTSCNNAVATGHTPCFSRG